MYWLILLACMGLYVSPLSPELAEGTYVLTRLTETGLTALVGTWLVAPKQVAHVVTPETQRGNADGGGYDIFGEGSSRIVTGQLRRREDSNVAISGAVKAAGLRDCLTCTLIREEEEELVLKDGSANRSAEDVLVECWCGLGLLKEVARVQERVAVELEDIPVKAIGALLD